MGGFHVVRDKPLPPQLERERLAVTSIQSLGFITVLGALYAEINYHKYFYFVFLTCYLLIFMQGKAGIFLSYIFGWFWCLLNFRNDFYVLFFFCTNLLHAIQAKIYRDPSRNITFLLSALPSTPNT